MDHLLSQLVRAVVKRLDSAQLPLLCSFSPTCVVMGALLLCSAALAGFFAYVGFADSDDECEAPLALWLLASASLSLLLSASFLILYCTRCDVVQALQRCRRRCACREDSRLSRWTLSCCLPLFCLLAVANMILGSVW